MTVCLIGDPPSERFHSMEIYEKALAEGLTGIMGIELRRRQWPFCRGVPKNKILATAQIYWNRHWFYPSRLKIPAADVYHILDQTYAHLLARLPPGKTVITCHDLMPMMVEGYGNSWGGKLSQASFRSSVAYLHRARYILADSEATKRALIDILNINERNVNVVPLGVEDMFCPCDPTMDHPMEDEVRYILQVGATAEPYKNTMNILRSFSLLLKNIGGQIKLLKVGKAYTKEQQSYIEEEGLAPHILHLGFVERKELPSVYRRSAVLLMPSLYEGFGMPLLEAMACGIPVVTADRGSIREVAGEAALYVDPMDPGDIAHGLVKVLSDNTLRQELIARGYSNAKKYTWQRTARETFTVYKKQTIPSDVRNLRHI